MALGFHAGDASVAAQAGMPDRLFKQHGRWKSDTTLHNFFFGRMVAQSFFFTKAGNKKLKLPV